MTESEALEIARKAVSDAADRVGTDLPLLDAELNRLALKDPQLYEAFVLSGHIFDQAKVAGKH